MKLLPNYLSDVVGWTWYEDLQLIAPCAAFAICLTPKVVACMAELIEVPSKIDHEDMALFIGALSTGNGSWISILLCGCYIVGMGNGKQGQFFFVCAL